MIDNVTILWIVTEIFFWIYTGWVFYFIFGKKWNR